MEESFRVRVDKTFGSLAAAASSSSSLNTASTPSLSSLWSLTDEELERREWNRERENAEDTESKPYPPNLDGFFANGKKLPSQTRDFQLDLEADLQDLDDGIGDLDDDGGGGDEGKRRELVKPDDHNEEEWEIRSSIGLDCTLDYEEEEDKYDKVAVGMKKANDRLYMRDITGYWTDLNLYGELPNTFKDALRDPRANHASAKLRLKEDAEAAGEFDTLQVSDTPKNTLEEGVNLKSIMKRKDNQVDPKTQKRVRFGSECKNKCKEEYEGTKDVFGNCSTQAEKSEASFPPQQGYAVPDYIRNPSKYTHYTFDSSSDSDEESNQKAYTDFLNQRRSPNSIEPQSVRTSSDLPKSITFTPKKKHGDDLELTNGKKKQKQGDVGKEFVPKKSGPVVIAAEKVQGSEVCEMEEDEPVNVATKNSSLRRQSRQYRTRADSVLDEPIT